VRAEPRPATSAETDWIESQSDWSRRRRLVMTAVTLTFLLYVVGPIGKYTAGAGPDFGYAILAAFGACWLAACALITGSWRFWTVYGVTAALFIAELPFAHAAAFVMCVCIAIVTVLRLEARATPIVLAMVLAAFLAPIAIPSWHDNTDTTFRNVTPVAILAAAGMAFVSAQVARSNSKLAEAQADLARLAAENERIRIARDLHDLLGHSLTTITVKAGLASRIGVTDPSRASQEMSEVETLARQALVDVRAAVENYRNVTLTGQLATGRELLRAAGITADLPHAVDIVSPAYQELFGWVVREGLTNIVRHSRASSCTIRVSASCVEIMDDGVGGAAQHGNGLSGLRERVAAAGGVFDAGPMQPKGWRLRVSLSSEASA
jgi:two-component system, NarL family, sensor histidine kinase DesK